MTTPTGQSPRPAQRQDGFWVEHWTTAGPVHGPLTLREAEAVVEREQVVVAESSPARSAGPGGRHLYISAVFAGWFGLAGTFVAIPILLVFGGFGPFMAGMWAFRRGDEFRATAWTLLGGFNATLALLFLLLATHLLGSALAQDTVRGTAGIFVVLFSLIVFALGGAALLKNWLMAAFFFALGLAYLFDGLGIWAGPSSWLVTTAGGQTSETITNWLLIIGGYVGMAAALVAGYLAIAIIVDSAAGRELVPAGSTRARGR